MAKIFGSEQVFQCDVGNDSDISQLFIDLGKHWDGFDGLVHAIAFAPAKRWMANSLTVSAAKLFVSRTTSAHTVFRLWPKPRYQ